MSVLGDRLDGLRPVVRCQTCAFLATLDDEDRAKMTAALDAPVDLRISSRALAGAIHGLPDAPRRSSIDVHRAGHR